MIKIPEFLAQSPDQKMSNTTQTNNKLEQEKHKLYIQYHLRIEQAQKNKFQAFITLEDRKQKIQNQLNNETLTQDQQIGNKQWTKEQLSVYDKAIEPLVSKHTEYTKALTELQSQYEQAKQKLVNKNNNETSDTT